KLASRQLQELLAILDAHLEQHGNILGGDFSLADLCVASVIGYSTWVGVSIADHTHVRRWLDRFQARESYQTVMHAAQARFPAEGAA
ncbi:MAG TPA: glutathione S-transferase family protein, partial [Polyangiaceae bacterium]